MDNYFEQLKNRIVDIYEKKNDNKLKQYNDSKLTKERFKTYKELEMHICKLLNKFSYDEDIILENSKFLKCIVEQYEEKKGNNITFGILNIKQNSNYNVYIVIFENKITYENLLFKSFKHNSRAKKYFKQLKEIIRDNNINDISRIILERI